MYFTNFIDVFVHMFYYKWFGLWRPNAIHALPVVIPGDLRQPQTEQSFNIQICHFVMLPNTFCASHNSAQVSLFFSQSSTEMWTPCLSCTATNTFLKQSWICTAFCMGSNWRCFLNHRTKFMISSYLRKNTLCTFTFLGIWMRKRFSASIFLII